MNASHCNIHFTACHSEPCEESKRIFADGNNVIHPLGSFARLRMTVSGDLSA